MGKNYFSKKVLQVIILFFLIGTVNVSAQVGIGTTTPNASSVLDITSTTQGMLTPRMTTAQRAAIVSPADGLMVYDTDLKAFHYYNSSTANWTVMNSAAAGRLKFKRIRSTDDLATELAAGGNTKYKLDSQTHYEINGVVVFNFPIDLNNASLIGIDTNEDTLFKTSGFLFEGATGGVVKNLTIAGGSSVFNLSGSGNTQGLIFRDCIVSGSANVGTVSGFALVFSSIVNYLGNLTGITYSNCSRVLLSNIAWFGNNSGTYEKFTGTFSLLEKQGGFCEVNGAAVGVDVSANPTITGDAVMEGVVFTGTLTTGGKYVNGYNPAIYTGFNFNNKWNVRCAGIPTESDLTAVGNINFASTTVTPASTTPVKLLGPTTSEDLFRFASNGSNRIDYLGSKKRFFQVGGSISFQTGDNNIVFIFYIAKNGLIISKSKVLVKSNSGTDVITTPIQTLTEMKNGDWIELFVATDTGSGNVSILSVNLSAN